MGDALSRGKAPQHLLFVPLPKARNIMNSASAVDGTEGVEVSTRDSHLSLKHQLLGPSLAKAGQDKVDQRKVSDVLMLPFTN
jgi:hypothetical protein